MYSRDAQTSVVKLEQIPKWSDFEPSLGNSSPSGDSPASGPAGPGDFVDPLTGRGPGGRLEPSRFPVDAEVNARIYLWRGAPWTLEVDAVVNSTNETLDEAHSSPGLHAAAGPSLADELATLAGCRTGEAKMTSGYDLPARKVIHTVGPRYAVKYHTAAENALNHCYRSVLELLIEANLESIAVGPIYSEAKGYPREPAAHVAIRTVRRFLEKHKEKIKAVVFCLTTASDNEIYRRLLPLYFPRDKQEEVAARLKLPADVGDEIGETVISERQIRISALPVGGGSPKDSHSGANTPSVFKASTPGRSSPVEEDLVDPSFLRMARDPDLRRREQLERGAPGANGWGQWQSILGLGPPPLNPLEEDALHSRYLTRANAVDLQDIADMKIVYRCGHDFQGHSVIVIVGAHFIRRALDLDRFVLHVVKEFEPVIQRPYSIVYFHSDTSFDQQPELNWFRRVEQILGRKHRTNLKTIYMLHPTLGLRAAVLMLQLLVQPQVWRKVVYLDKLLDLFRYVPREQLTIPDFVVQHDLEVNGDNVSLINTIQGGRRRNNQPWLGTH